MTKLYIPPTAVEVIPRIVRGWQGLSFSRSSVVRRWADERTDVRVAGKRIGITLTLRQRWCSASTLSERACEWT